PDHRGGRSVSPLVPKPPPMPDEQESGAAPAASPPGAASPFEPIEAVQAATEEREPHGEPAPVPEPSEVEVPRALAQEIRRAIKRYPRKRSAAIPALWAVQRRYGWCTPEGIRQAAAVMGVTPGYLQSVASFYDLFRLEPQGEHQVLVCTNISCWLAGADRLLDSFCEAAGATPGGSSEDGKLFVRGFECLGACDIAPMASIDERYYGPLTDEDAAAAIEQLRSGKNVLPGKRLEDRGAAGGKRGSGDKRIARHPVNKGTRPKRPAKPAAKPQGKR
ncbi:MAG TPA: NAD(P)H-dependent oxidoreductase subunit E, partial [Solirubrobacterales bacterium]|nr:NAD(P)H-dependent oxidoreductase subunit E [Solirubrobacterales bacterium]